jgi:hypothetical protein
VYAGGDEGGAPEETVPGVIQCALLHTDDAVAHGHMMGIMNVLRAGEYLEVAFVALVAGLR